MMNPKIFNRFLKILISLIAVFIVLFFLSAFFSTQYFSSDGFSGESIRIYFGFFYSYELNSDIGQLRKQTGYLLSSEDKYSFMTFPFFNDSSKFFPRSYYKISWSGRNYLVREESIPFFCNSFNSGWLKKDFNNLIAQPFLINNFDIKSKPIGKPHLPKRFETQIFESPIEAIVLEKYPEKYSIKINKGKFNNLFVDCFFFDNNKNELMFKIIELYESTSILQIFNADELVDAKNDNYSNIKIRYDSLMIGSILSTLDLKQ